MKCLLALTKKESQDVGLAQSVLNVVHLSSVGTGLQTRKVDL